MAPGTAWHDIRDVLISLRSLSVKINFPFLFWQYKKMNLF